MITLKKTQPDPRNIRYILIDISNLGEIVDIYSETKYYTKSNSKYIHTYFILDKNSNLNTK